MDDARIHITFDGIFLHLVERQDFAHQYLTQALLFDFFMDPSFNCPHQNFRDISGNTFFFDSFLRAFFKIIYWPNPR